MESKHHKKAWFSQRHSRYKESNPPREHKKKRAYTHFLSIPLATEEIKLKLDQWRQTIIGQDYEGKFNEHIWAIMNYA